MRGRHFWINLVMVLLLLLLSSCASPPGRPQWQNSRIYTATIDDQLTHRFAPVFVAEGAEKEYNRIGTPVVLIEQEQEVVKVDPREGAIYTSVRQFTTEKSDYTNIFYRVHFPQIPLRYLGAGQNIGLLVVVTLDDHKQPVLYTLVHTCGCYLAFIPTSHLPEESWQEGWKRGRQNVFGENLPRYLEFSGTQKQMLTILLRPGNHRVKNVWLMEENALDNFAIIRLQTYPFEALTSLPLPDGGTTSFYETSGARQDYVKGSYKIWERLLISWWAFDLRVGEDKRLGSSTEDGVVFYTSLKPWAREESDLRDFPKFLRYWGWRL